MRAWSEISEPALVWIGNAVLDGRVAIPPGPVAVVLFASSPSLCNPVRDEQIVSALYEMKVATAYVPLLTDDEQQFDARTHHLRLDAEFLAQRFLDVAQWITQSRTMRSLPIGLIGSSGSAAGALLAAAARPDLFQAVVSVDGRTDLATESLRAIKAPTLLVVNDMPVLRMNREALARLRGERRLEIIHGDDGHACEQIAQKAIRWFEENLALVPSDAYGMV
jgi:putative phosphoribosyl transferase